MPSSTIIAGDFALRGAGERRVEDAPFGAFAPSRLQAAVIALASVGPLRHGVARWWASRLVEMLRPGPLDVQRLGLRLRLHHYGHNASEKKLVFAPDLVDPQEVAAILACGERPLHFADIGANAGAYSLIVKARRPDAKVIAFEPLAALTRRLAFNIRANDLADMHVVTAAVGAERGTMQFYLADESLVGEGPSVSVPVVPLYDSLVAQGFTRLDAMKIDIEGFEDRVLAAFFARAPDIFWPRVIVVEHAHNGLWQSDALALLTARSYRETARTKANAILVRES